MRTSSFSGACLSLAVLIATVPAAHAAAPKPAKPASAASSAAAPAAAASKPGDGPAVMTREELRTCRAKKSQIEKLKVDLDTEQASVQALQADIEQRTAQLKQKTDSVDRTKQEAIDAYNAEVKERQALVDDFDGRVNTFNAHVASGREMSDAYAKDCGNRPFYDSDAKALDQGK